MRKLRIVCFAVLICVPSVRIAPAAEPGELLDPGHWVAKGAPELLGEVARQIQSLEPEDSRSLARAGHVLLRAGKAEEAAAVFQSAQKSDPKDDETFLIIAMAYSERKMWSEADVWFGRAVERDPKDLDHVIEWGVSYWVRGDREKAAQMFVKALKSDPKNDRLYYKIGRGIQ